MAELSSGPPTRSGGTQLLQDQIKELILRLDLSAGDAMPTEAELATRLNVGRNSVREAIKALQAVGIVEVRRGRGMYVGKMSLGALVDELTFHTRITLRDGRSGLAELTEVREALESGLAQRMIIREQGPDLRELGQVLETMEQEARAGRISPAVDRLFHEVLFRPLGNTLVSRLLGAFWDTFHQIEHELAPATEPPIATLQRHRAIYAAIAAADPAATATAMAAHFAGVRHRLASPPTSMCEMPDGKSGSA
ncbi:FCD domain-containing protein [Kribbella sp. NBC_01245]|uniref:FadR/GntR family transcriptional regulator n=1 Tax=Kribbella sp. NBC_01245 TaxID=2903578 RepID=UPI002E2C5D5B|nr:FCD domain-containing protein [Kribbella sp. NBC_01245]